MSEDGVTGEEMMVLLSATLDAIRDHIEELVARGDRADGEAINHVVTQVAALYVFLHEESR